jgi:hypothetical protein
MSIREQHAAVVRLCEKALDETATFSSRGETYKAIETWLDNVVSTLISWGTDIRIDEDSHTCIEGSSLHEALLTALFGIDNQINTLLERVRNRYAGDQSQLF